MNDSVEGPGETLRVAREAMEISCREVAEALNLPVNIVEAIEANDYEALPGSVFTRGYIRAYAKLLELDSDPVVARYPAGGADTETAEVVPTQSSLGALLREHSQRVLGGAGLLVIVVLLAVWLWPSGDDASADDAANPPSPPASRAEPARTFAQERQAGQAGMSVPAAMEAGEPATGPRPGTAPPSGMVAEDKPAPEVATPTAARADAVEPSPDRLPESSASATPPTAAPAGMRRITPTGSDRLWFRFTDDCWVEIKSASGANLYSDLSRGGRTLELVGQAPFRILLGYAPGVEIAFNDEAVALAPHTRNNVANLVLGQ